MSDAADNALNEATIKVLTWKPSVVRNVARCIVERVVCEPFGVWPDELVLDFVSDADVNSIGIAWRLLTRAGVIRHTANFRRSTAEGARGRTIFLYQLSSMARAQTFLQRNGFVELDPQGQLFRMN